MKRSLCTLAALGLLLGLAGQGQGQPTYSFATLDAPGSSFPDSSAIYANGINASGQIVGYYYGDADGNVHGFLYDQGSYTTIDVPGADPY